MFRSVFLEDVARLYRNGLLPGACYRAMSHRYILLFYAAFAAAFVFLTPHIAIAIALSAFIVVFATCAHLWDCMTNKITPLCFGTFLIGRLNGKHVIYARYPSYWAEFTLIPSAEQLTVRNLACGTEGATYLLVQHPTEPSIVLAIIDDDPRYMEVMRFATDDRRAEIMAEVARLRGPVSVER
jgi:hypothetical protein